MYRRLLALTFALGIASAGFAQEPPSCAIPVAAHFMDWATVPGGWATSAHMPERQDNRLGGYDSTNKEIIAQQNREMQANCIVPWVSWWARDTYAGDEFLDIYLPIPGPQIGILYEATSPGRMKQSPNGDISMDDPANAEMFISDMQHLQEKYFNRYPNRFFHIDGRPVVFIWISHAFTGAFDKVVARAREKSSFYLIGSDLTVPFSARPGLESVIRGMDAISSYGIYDSVRYGPEVNQKFLDDYGSAMRYWQFWLKYKAPGVNILLPMAFSYDETRIPGRRGFVFQSTPELAREFAQLVRKMILDPCNARIVPVAYITSYNEHFEGSSIEPFKIEDPEDIKKGYTPTMYLDIIPETFKPTIAVPEGPASCRPY